MVPGMSYTESDLEIEMIDVEEDADDKRRRWMPLALFASGFGLVNCVLVVSALSLFGDVPESNDVEVSGPRELTLAATETTPSQAAPDAGVSEESHPEEQNRFHGRKITGFGTLHAAVSGVIHSDLKVEVVHQSDPGEESSVSVRVRGPWSELDDEKLKRNLAEIEATLKRHAGDGEITLTMAFDDGRPDLTSSAPSLADDLAIQVVNSDFRYIYPRVYRSVSVSVECRDEAGRPVRESDGAVVWIEILVNAAVWDAETTEERVNLLNDTAIFLSDRYPEVTPYVTLKFDDGRAELPLKSSIL